MNGLFQMNQMNKRLVIMIAIIAITIVLSACGSNATPNGTLQPTSPRSIDGHAAAEYEHSGTDNAEPEPEPTSEPKSESELEPKSKLKLKLKLESEPTS